MLLHSNLIETIMVYIHCFRLFSMMNANHTKQTTYSRCVLHILLDGGSTPPTSTRLKNTTEDCGVFESSGPWANEVSRTGKRAGVFSLVASHLNNQKIKVCSFTNRLSKSSRVPWATCLELVERTWVERAKNLIDFITWTMCTWLRMKKIIFT